MVKHIVMYKLKHNTPENVKSLVEVFRSMEGKIEHLIKINVGADFLQSPRSYDVVLECVFDSMQTMELYACHPIHMKIVDYVKSVVEKSHSVDYII